MVLLSQQPAGPARRATSPAGVLAIVCAGVVLASLDLFIVNVALPSIARDFGNADLGDLSWVLNAYAIVYAALLVLFGRLAEGHRRDLGFLLGVAVFTAASAACAGATGVAMLVACRAVQAAGAALLTPASLSLVLATAPADRRGGAVRAWTATGGLAAALGPVVGGLLVAVSWRWVFLVNVPVGLAALAVGWRRLPHVPGHPVRLPDATGAVLVTAGVGTLSYGLVEGGTWGWSSAPTVGVLLAAAVLVGLFVLRCARHDNPLVDPSLFAARAFGGANGVLLLFSAAFGAMLLSIVLWDQEVWHWSALRTGLAVAPGPLMVPLFAFLVAGRLIARLGNAAVVAAGLACFAAGSAWWALAVGPHPDYVGAMLGGMLLTGAGVGLTLPTTMAAATAPLPASAFATGSAVVNMVRQVGLALGVAALVAVLGSPAGPLAALHAFRHGWWMVAALAALAVVPAALWLRRPPPTAGAGAAAPRTAGRGPGPGPRRPPRPTRGSPGPRGRGG